MQDVVEAAVERRERSRFSRSRLRDERRIRSSNMTPASVLGNIPEVAYTTPPATAVRSEQEMEMSVIGQEIVEGGGRNARATGESNRPTAEVAERDGSDKPKWTVLQAWSVFGFATCTVPWYLAYDEEKKEYVTKSHWLQLIFCILQHAFTLIVAVMSLAYVTKLVARNPTPFTYIQILGILLTIATRLWFTKVVFMNRNSILEYHNMEMEITLEETEGHASSKTTSTLRRSHKSSAKVIGLSFLCFGIFLALMAGSDFGIGLQEYDEDWRNDGLPAVVQSFACFARTTYYLKDEDTCGLEYIADKVSDLPSSEKAWSILGSLTFVNEKVARYQKFIGINTCIWMFYADAANAMRIIQNTDQRAIRIYDYLKTREECLSSFVGSLLALQMMEIATNIPEWSTTLFSKNIFVPMYIVTILAGFFIFLVLGCYATLIAERVEDELVGQRGRSSRPSTPRQMTAFVFQLFRSSVGIGVKGIYKLNFAFLCTYMCTIGTWVMVLYEVEH